jgi:DNA-binding NarL/FixJ family response regulator
MTAIRGETFFFKGTRAPSAPLTWGQRWIWDEVTHFGQHHNELNFAMISHVREYASIGDICVAIRQLIERYEILRTNFRVASSGETYQHVMQDGRFTVDIMEIQDDTEDLRSLESVRQMVRLPFSFEHDVPVRFVLCLRNDTPALVLIILPHVVADFWSGKALVRELEDLISSLSQGRIDGSNSVVQQAVDRADWEASSQGLRRSERSIAFANGQMENLPARLIESTASRPENPPVQDLTMGSAALKIALDNISEQYGVSTSDALLFCVATSLSSLRRNESCGLMLYSSNRYGALQDPALGTIVQDVPVRVSARDDSLRDALSKVASTARRAYLSGQYHPESMEQLIRSSAASRLDGGPDVSCSLNMLLSSSRTRAPGDLGKCDSTKDLAALQGRTWLRKTKVQACDRIRRRFYLVAVTDGDQVGLTLKVHTESIDLTAAESILRELEDRAIYYSQRGE